MKIMCIVAYGNTEKEVNKIYNETKDVNKVIDLINFEINNCCLENNLSLKLVFKLVQSRNRYFYKEVI